MNKPTAANLFSFVLMLALTACGDGPADPSEVPELPIGVAPGKSDAVAFPFGTYTNASSYGKWKTLTLREDGTFDRVERDGSTLAGVFRLGASGSWRYIDFLDATTLDKLDTTHLYERRPGHLQLCVWGTQKWFEVTSAAITPVPQFPIGKFYVTGEYWTRLNTAQPWVQQGYEGLTVTTQTYAWAPGKIFMSTAGLTIESFNKYTNDPLTIYNETDARFEQHWRGTFDGWDRWITWRWDDEAQEWLLELGKEALKQRTVGGPAGGWGETTSYNRKVTARFSPEEITP